MSVHDVFSLLSAETLVVYRGIAHAYAPHRRNVGFRAKVVQDVLLLL